MDVEHLAEELASHIDDVAGDTALTQAQSAEIYEYLAEHCKEWAKTIRSEME